MMKARRGPAYTRDHAHRTEVIRCLQLLERSQAGEPLTEEEQQLVTRLDRPLKRRQRECLRYYYQEGLTHEEIAERINVHTTTVYRNCAKGEEAISRFGMRSDS